MGRKPTLWTIQAINKRNLTRENLDVVKKKKREISRKKMNLF